MLESTETNLENPETHAVPCEKELQEDDSGNWGVRWMLPGTLGPLSEKQDEKQDQ